MCETKSYQSHLCSTNTFTYTFHSNSLSWCSMFPFPAMTKLCNMSGGFPSTHPVLYSWENPTPTDFPSALTLCWSLWVWWLALNGKVGRRVFWEGIPHRHRDTAAWRQADVKELFTCDWKETLLWGSGNIPPSTHSVFHLSVCWHVQTFSAQFLVLMKISLPRNENSVIRLNHYVLSNPYGILSSVEQKLNILKKNSCRSLTISKRMQAP